MKLTFFNKSIGGFKPSFNRLRPGDDIYGIKYTIGGLKAYKFSVHHIDGNYLYIGSHKCIKIDDMNSSTDVQSPGSNSTNWFFVATTYDELVLVCKIHGFTTVPHKSSFAYDN